MNNILLVIVLILLLIGAFPAWPHSANWGHGPVSVLGVVIIVIIALLLTGKL